MSSKQKAYLLCPFGSDSGLYRGWPDQLSVAAETIDNYRSNWECPPDAAILISHMHYRWEEANILRRTLDRGSVPVLVLADGVLEYRNTFENPTIADGSMYQPVFGHKIACIGRAQARMLEAWGNVGRCEVIGVTRFDKYLSSETEVRDKQLRDKQLRDKQLRAKQFRVLVATATTPYFDDGQKALTVQSLLDLKKWFEQNNEFEGRQVHPVWRLTAGLDDHVGVSNQGNEELFDLLNSVDALITTPSTLALEGALKSKPVAMLGYHPSPQFMPTAWNITHEQQIGQTIAELLDPPRAKMLFQQMTLHDQLECHSPALPRMLELVEAMIREARPNSGPPVFPPRIVTDPNRGFHTVEDSFQLEELFPNNKSFSSSDVTRLQTELSRAILRLGQLPDELLENREYNRYLARRLHQVRERLQRRNSRVWDLRQEVSTLTKRVEELTEKNSTPDTNR